MQNDVTTERYKRQPAVVKSAKLIIGFAFALKDVKCKLQLEKQCYWQQLWQVLLCFILFFYIIKSG